MGLAPNLEELKKLGLITKFLRGLVIHNENHNLLQRKTNVIPVVFRRRLKLFIPKWRDGAHRSITMEIRL